MAMQNTLSLPELLENIISHLPEEDILCNAQRVSRHWKTIIDTSPTIQKKIWLQPEEQPAISPVDYDEDDVKIFSGTPIYPRTTLTNPLLTRKDDLIAHRQLSRDFAVRIKPMKLYGQPTGHVHFRPNLMMAPPKIYWQTYTRNKISPSPLPSWCKMYLSQPPVVTVMLMVAYQHPAPPGSRSMFKVMIREKDGVTLGHVYETFASTIPVCDENLMTNWETDPITAHVCWYETDTNGGKGKGSEDDGSEGKGSGEDSSEDDGSEDGSTEDDGSGDEGSVIYDSDGSVIEASSSEMGDSRPED